MNRLILLANCISRNSALSHLRGMAFRKDLGTYCDTDVVSYKENKLIYPAASRNKDPILNVFKQVLNFSYDEKPFLLEISSGSGQHVAHFAPHFPNMTFQPSEVEPDLLGSISIYVSECPTNNIKKPIIVDATIDLGAYGFAENSIDVIYNCNMIHVSPFDCTISLFKNAGKYLKRNGIMITYGPYANNGVITPESNVTFDQSLRGKDPRWGIRDIQDLLKLAGENSISLKNTFDLPANNKCLIWLKGK